MKQIKRSKTITSFISSLVLFSSLVLLSFSNVNAAFDPAFINVKGVEVVPVLKITQAYDSNILSQKSGGEGDSKTLVKVKANASIKKGANKYSFDLGLGSGLYAGSSADNFFDSNAGISLYQSFTRKISFKFNANRVNTHENRGSGYSKGIATQLTEPDKYHINKYQGVFSYGSEDAIGRIVVRLRAEDRIYDTRRSITKTRDRNSLGGVATFYYRVLPKTSALLEFSQRSFDYTNNEAFNSNEQHYFTGAKWDISTITSGTVKAGILKKNFDNSNRDNFTGFSWQIGARWTPLTYSTIDVVTKGRTEETNGSGDFINAKSIITKWTHFWNDKVDTVVITNLTKNNYEPNGRSENFFNLTLQANYNARRWMDVGVSYSNINNRSSDDRFEFTKNIVAVNVSLAL